MTSNLPLDLVKAIQSQAFHWKLHDCFKGVHENVEGYFVLDSGPLLYEISFFWKDGTTGAWKNKVLKSSITNISTDFKVWRKAFE